MRSFQMRLNPDNEWDRMIIEFLTSIPRYYRSHEVRRILIAHILALSGAAGKGQGTGAPVASPPAPRREEDDELGARLDNLF